MGFAQAPSLPVSPRRRARCPRVSPRAAAQDVIGLPASYDQMRIRACSAISLASEAGVRLQEVQFPSVPNLNTAALNELLDANRAHARSMLTRLRTTMAARDFIALFPDKGEATLASRAWRTETPCVIASLDAPPSVQDVTMCVNPGFNVSEWFALEELTSTTIVTLNADLDRVRSGYYPRLFYPRLYKTRTTFLCKFQEVFYLKPLADGGTLFREFPNPWSLFYRPLPDSRNDPPPPARPIWSGDTRLQFKEAQAMLKAKRTEDQLRGKKVRK